MNLYVAPMQGYTDAAWRHYHHEIYPAGKPTAYFTPFIRLERGEPRRRDVADLTSALNSGLDLTPQIIFRDVDELTALVDYLKRDAAVRRIDLNMGCPFPLQTSRGRGAAAMLDRELVTRLPEVIGSYADIRFSVKMRLGYSAPDEWQPLVAALNQVTLSHITFHPRTAREQYSGSLHAEQVEAVLATSRNPVVLNGDISSVEDIHRISGIYPQVSGIMCGRGLLRRPSLFAELTEGAEWDVIRRRQKMLEFHSKLMDYYGSKLCGESQILAHLRPFWEYAEAEIGRRAWKQLRKAGSLASYRRALQNFLP